jgi:hypothetical protein
MKYGKYLRRQVHEYEDEDKIKITTSVIAVSWDVEQTAINCAGVGKTEVGQHHRTIVLNIIELSQS